MLKVAGTLFTHQFMVDSNKLLTETELAPLERIVAHQLVAQPRSLIELLIRSFMTGHNGGSRSRQEKLISGALMRAALSKKVHPCLLLTKALANGYQFVECRGSQRGGVRVSTKVARSVERSLRVACTLLSKVAKKHDGKTCAEKRLQRELAAAYEGRESALIRARDEGLKMAAAANV